MDEEQVLTSATPSQRELSEEAEAGDDPMTPGVTRVTDRMVRRY